MVRYHTVNIGKKVYEKIEEYAKTETIFDNVKAFILHSVANQMKDNKEDTAALKALEKAAEKHDISEEKITDYLEEAREDLIK
jgi:hypothetical protein